MWGSSSAEMPTLINLVREGVTASLVVNLKLPTPKVVRHWIHQHHLSRKPEV